MRGPFLTCAITIAAFASSIPGAAEAAPSYVDRPITLPRLTPAFDVGLGVGHVKFGNYSETGAAMNFEAALGVTSTFELGIRTGYRFDDSAKVGQADVYARTNGTETYGSNGTGAVANPELRAKFALARLEVVEIAVDARAYMPTEDQSRFGVMAGLPFLIRAGNLVRIDTGVYVPVVFYDPTVSVVSLPGYVWFQASEKFWVGPMAALRFVNLGSDRDRTDLLLGGGLGYQLARIVDLKAQMFFPRINQDDGLGNVGAGIGLQVRIE